ncbi:MAG TPA: type II toxin-antitoxin system RelE/ParE family toxin [Sphingomonadaceae bacterium]
MTTIYRVVFRPRAQKVFDRLGTADQRQLAVKLKQRAANPRVPADAVREIPEGYKIKLRSAGIRLIYQVREHQVVILVLAIGKRERQEAYGEAIRELGKLDDRR